MMIKKSLDKLNPRVKELEALVETQAACIDGLRSKRFRIPSGAKKRKGSSYVRVLIPDTHGAHLDTKAAGAFLSDLEVLKPAEIVRLGDHIDCGGFLALHHTMGFVAETSYSYEEDKDAANVFIDETRKRTGPIEDWYVIGNHEARIEKWIVEQTLRHPRDAAYLYRLFGTENILGLAERGIQVVKRDVCYHGLNKRGTIKLGKCIFHHGVRVGEYAAKRTLDDLGANVCFAHTHRMSSHVREFIDGLKGAWSFGCLCQLHPLYGNTNISGWCHGYGIQIVGKDGSFMTISVPIVDGKSYLSNLLGGLG